VSDETTFSTFETELQVRPDDIDLNGHVHNSKYLDYVLAARFDQMERCYHMSMTEFLDRGLTWFVKAAFIEHKRPLFMGDWMIVKTRIADVQQRGVRVSYEILRRDTNKLSAIGYFDYTLINTETGRATDIPEDIIAKYSV
tara:strand:- start:1703 stop:2125 length:423 start_codon:yes stop_codon:yes gene_type:complete